VRKIIPVAIPLFCLVAILGFCLYSSPARAMEPGPGLTSFSEEIHDLTSTVSPCVVQIFTSSYGAVSGSLPQGAAVFGNQQATGSGIILDPNGYILTNHHVVAGAKKVQVLLSGIAIGNDPGTSILAGGGGLVGAQVVGIDKDTDLAVLKINKKDLPYLKFGNSDDLFQGQLVFAFGSPMGLTNSVSFGVVSSVARQLERDNPMIYIQTDVAVNPGNSGGPLVNIAGEVVGVNTLIFTQSGGSEGLSFSVPSNVVSTVFNQIIATGRVKRGIIGVHVQTLNPWIANSLGMTTKWGVILGDVYPNSPAYDAGLKVGDVVVSLDGKPMTNSRQFEVNLYGKKIDSEVTIEVLRNGKSLTKKVKVMERIEPDHRFYEMISSKKNLVERLGVLCLDLNSQTSSMLPLQSRRPEGVIVAALAVSSSPFGEQFFAGDIIYAVNGTSVTNLKELKKVVRELGYGERTVLQVERGGQLRYLMIEVE
jgi:serine protease Do